MSKTVLITGSTDGIGLQAAEMLAAQGHRVLIHGRTPAKVEAVAQRLGTQGYVADLSRLSDVEDLAAKVAAEHPRLDALINNAGVFKTSVPRVDGLDVRFLVNVLAPYVLTQRLLPTLAGGRVVNLSSAAQSDVNLAAVRGDVPLSDFEAYAQSKLALTAWSAWLAGNVGEDGPWVVSVNPGSMLGTNMVKDGFGVAGRDIGIGARILVDLAVGDQHAPSGSYFDNDAGDYGPPHPAAHDAAATRALLSVLDGLASA